MPPDAQQRPAPTPLPAAPRSQNGPGAGSPSSPRTPPAAHLPGLVLSLGGTAAFGWLSKQRFAFLRLTPALGMPQANTVAHERAFGSNDRKNYIYKYIYLYKRSGGGPAPPGTGGYRSAEPSPVPDPHSPHVRRPRAGENRAPRSRPRVAREGPPGGRGGPPPARPRPLPSAPAAPGHGPGGAARRPARPPAPRDGPGPSWRRAAGKRCCGLRNWRVGCSAPATTSDSVSFSIADCGRKEVNKNTRSRKNMFQWQRCFHSVEQA